MACAAAAALRDDLLSHLGRRAGDELVRMHREAGPEFGRIQQRRGLMAHARVACEHLAGDLPRDLRSFARLRLAWRDRDIATDSEVVWAAGDAEPVGLGAVGIEDLLDTRDGLERRADLGPARGRLDSRSGAYDRRPFGGRRLLQGARHDAKVVEVIVPAMMRD